MQYPPTGKLVPWMAQKEVEEIVENLQQPDHFNTSRKNGGYRGIMAEEVIDYLLYVQKQLKDWEEKWNLSEK